MAFTMAHLKTTTKLRPFRSPTQVLFEGEIKDSLFVPLLLDQARMLPPLTLVLTR